MSCVFENGKAEKDNSLYFIYPSTIMKYRPPPKKRKGNTHRRISDTIYNQVFTDSFRMRIFFVKSNFPIFSPFPILPSSPQSSHSKPVASLFFCSYPSSLHYLTVADAASALLFLLRLVSARRVPTDRPFRSCNPNSHKNK